MDNEDTQQLDNLTDKPKWGGKRDGSGRKEGSKNKATLEQQEVKKAFIDRVNTNADRLFNAQLDLAIGEKYLMVKRVSGTGKERKAWVEIVTDTETIKEFLDDETDLNNGDDFYYMTTRPANGIAIDSLLNRSIGKPTEKMEIEHSGELKTAEMNPELAAEFTDFLKKKTEE